MDGSTKCGARATAIKSRGDAAVALMQRGLKVFPLKAGEKVPLLPDWQNNTFATAAGASKIPAEVNLGCFLSDGFVLDFDVKNGKDGLKFWESLRSRGAPETYVQRTPTGGLHAFYRCAASVRNSASKIAPGVDVRGTGGTGYVVGAGSSLPHGEYTVEIDAPIAEAPDWLVDLVAQPSRSQAANPRTSLVGFDAPPSIERAKTWLINEAQEAVQNDGGDHATFAVAAMVRDFGVSEETCFELMSEHWNLDKAFPPWDADDLEVKVGNVYRYSQKPAGTRSPMLVEVEFEPEPQQASDQPRKGRELTLVRDVEKDLKAEPRYLIEGLYDRNSMVVVYGESNSGKTHVVLDQAFAIASGRQWAGKRTQRGLVVYVAAEGGDGIQLRIMAHKAKYGAAAVDASLVLDRAPINLRNSEKDVNDLIDAVRAAELQTGERCVLLVVDTLSRALAGGDENSSGDMGDLVRRCDKVRNAINATFLLVHHSGKNRDKGARGHSLLRAATDTEIEILNQMVSVTKQRDMAAGAPITFRYEEVPLGEDRDGRAVHSVILQTGAAVEFALEQSPVQATVLAAASAAARRVNRGGLVRRSDIIGESAKARGVIVDKALKNAVDHALRELADSGAITKSKRGQYLVTQKLTS